MKWFFSRTETLKNGESSIGDHRHFSEFRRVKNDSLRSTIIGATNDLWVKLNEKPWFFWLLFSSRKKVTTLTLFNEKNEPCSFFYQEVKNSLLSLFIGLRESKTFEDQALAQGSNQKRLLNFYKDLAIASLCCGCHRWRTFAACFGSIARFIRRSKPSPVRWGRRVPTQEVYRDEPHLRSLRSIALCKSLVSWKQ